MGKESIKIEQTRMRGKPLHILRTGELVTYYQGSLLFYDIESEELKQEMKLNNQFLKKLLYKVRIIERVSHSEVRWMFQDENDDIYFAYANHIYICDRNKRVCREIDVGIRGTPLQVNTVKGVQGFDDQIVTGDYGQNNKREAVSLYSLREKQWKKVYTFDRGRIKHIHGIFADIYRGCVYILTGDLDDESGIWEARNNFSEVRPILMGSQKYRACQMMITPKRIFYCSDAPSEPNYIYEIIEGDSKKVAELYGSCIYGVADEEEGFFSTTVEPEATPKNFLDRYLSNKIGAGIKGRDTIVFRISEEKGYEEIIRFTHDGLPLRLCQYGVVTFSNIVDNMFFFSPLCVKDYDRKIFKVEF